MGYYCTEASAVVSITMVAPSVLKMMSTAFTAMRSPVHLGVAAAVDVHSASATMVSGPFLTHPAGALKDIAAVAEALPTGAINDMRPRSKPNRTQYSDLQGTVDLGFHLWRQTEVSTAEAGAHWKWYGHWCGKEQVLGAMAQCNQWSR